VAAKKKAAKKSAAKKSSAKRSVKKSAKRTTAKPSAKKKAAKKSSRAKVRYSIPAVPVSGSSRSSVSTISTTPKPASVTPTPAASESAAPTEQPSAEPSGAPLAAHEAPVGIVSLYNATGATVNWKAPAASEGITGYNIELRDNGVGEWKLVATVPATQFKQQITKNDSTGWVQVKVSTVYSDGVVSEGKVHGLPGSWS